MIALCANPLFKDAWKEPLVWPYWLPFNSPELEEAFGHYDRRIAREKKAKKKLANFRRGFR